MNDMIQSISRYANSQNKVSDADFFSNTVPSRLEEHSRRVWAPPQAGLSTRRTGSMNVRGDNT